MNPGRKSVKMQTETAAPFRSGFRRSNLKPHSVPPLRRRPGMRPCAAASKDRPHFEDDADRRREWFKFE